jgi:hypothetical protein
MFWQLLLAHFIADYPLQPTWMVRKKVNPAILLLHVLVHFLVMLVVLLPATAAASSGLWFYCLIIAAIHFAIDTGKNWLTIHRPRWIIWPYVVDQICHILSIGLVSMWAMDRTSPQAFYLSPHLAVIGVGFLLVTYVYLITERVISSASPLPRRANDTQAWSRMFIRAALLAALLLSWNARGANLTALAFVLPYTATRSGIRSLVVDLLVTLLTATLVIMLNGR